MPVLRTNDLRHYLNQRLAASAAEAANDSARKGDAPAPKPDSDKVGPVLKSLDAVLNHILASGKGGAPRALLVAGASPKIDATAEAIAIARALVAKREQVVLVDITRGAASVSGALGLPRAPGLTDLAAGRASFENVVRIDADTSLQVISAGNPKLAASGDENERFTRLFEALTQAYDSVVLHADREAMRQAYARAQIRTAGRGCGFAGGHKREQHQDRLDRLFGAWLPGLGLRAKRQEAALAVS